ncbi:hypothetical protein KAZ82_01175 [Candidatus Babeliales bacterium]|nr:hypothetical protein [Candidatus Babeliales bacterium]
MKKLFFTLITIPLLAGCWWNKKPDTVEATHQTFAEAHPKIAAKVNEFEHLMGEAELDDEYLSKSVNGELNEK